MPDRRQIEQQQRLLETHRRTLADRLQHQALVGVADTKPAVLHDIREARDQIERIKDTLRRWSVAVEDFPDDDDPDALRRARVFLSYKRDVEPDQSVALEICTALRQQHEVFIDQVMSVGIDWVARIKAELCRANVLIVLLSARAVGSEMLQGEIEQARDWAMAQGGRPAILPVRLAYRVPFPYPFSDYLNHLNWAIWDGPQDTPRLIAELLRAIEGGDLPLALPQEKAALLQHSVSPPFSAPVPAAQPAPLELPEGTMDPESAFYIARDTDRLALETIRLLGGIITIKGPRQMGKSSLLIRTVAAAQAVGKRTVLLDFQLFDQTDQLDADLFFRRFCAWLTDKLELEDRVDQYWSVPLSNPQRCTRYLSRYLLKELDAPLVLAMDEVERIFDAPFRSDFFSMLRSWYNSRASEPQWKRLDLVLVTSTEPYLLIANLNQSPFNVGQVISLADFTPAQVADLNVRHGTPLSSPDLQALVDLLGGHPYLTRRALYLVASGQSSFAELFARSTDDRGPFGDHLRYHLFRLHDRPELVQGLRQVLHSGTVSDEQIFFRLHGAGLVRGESRAAQARCRLYAEYFRERVKG